MNSQGAKKKVFVGMSGGVDSSVSAALLKEAGFDVTGVFIKVWQPPFMDGCTAKDDRQDAMRVAAQLGIPFKTLDLEKEYKKEVVDYMIAEYKAGRTPNPDVMCNRHVKFGAFLKWALREGAEYVATGHYAVNRELIINNQELECRLKESKDKNKDQTYFLWTLTQKQLKHILFPVGHLTKPEVRILAKKFNLSTAGKKDSQGLCFIGKVDIKTFLGHFIKPKRGILLNQEGDIIGSHEGAWFYTIGQRHGFTVTKKTSSDSPYYVIAKNVKKNTLTVAHKNIEDKDFKTKIIRVSNINWISSEKMPPHFVCFARFRYRQKLELCTMEKMSQGGVIVNFKKSQKRISNGQSIVFYKKGLCLGGGVIKAVL